MKWIRVIRAFFLNTIVFMVVGSTIGVFLNFYGMSIGSNWMLRKNYLLIAYMFGVVIAFAFSGIYNLNYLYNLLRHNSQEVELFNVMMYSLLMGVSFLLVLSGGNFYELIHGSSPMLPLLLSFPLSAIGAAFVLQRLRKYYS